MTLSEHVEEFWKRFSTARMEADEKPPGDEYEAWYFCNNEKDANELGDLVLKGIKTATASLHWVYEAENEKVPEPGDFSVITDWDGNPLCVIETTEVRILPFNEVDPAFAHDEGEGDRSLGFWREVHWRFFSMEAADIGREPEETMPVVCERFRVIYKE